MSGHSKWSTIKRQKGVTDAKRGAAFTKAANAITIAAREGGESTETNFKLRLLIEAARKLNMPKDNIQRAINRGVGKGSERSSLEEITYEGFGPSGVAILVLAVTDNKQRTAQTVRSVFDRGGGSLGGPGSVSYIFDSAAVIDVKLEDTTDDPDRILIAAADAGADDIEVDDGTGVVYCKPQELEKIKKDLENSHLKIVGSELTRKPKSLVRIEDLEKAKKVLNLMRQLEDLEDVQKVYANFDIPDEIIQREAV